MNLTDRRKKLLARAIVNLGDRLHQHPGLRAELWALAHDLGCAAELMALCRAWVPHAAKAAAPKVAEVDAWLANESAASLPVTDMKNKELHDLADKFNYDAVVELERRWALGLIRKRQADDEPRPNGSTARKGQALETGVEEVP